MCIELLGLPTYVYTIQATGHGERQKEDDERNKVPSYVWKREKEKRDLKKRTEVTQHTGYKWWWIG